VSEDRELAPEDHDLPAALAALTALEPKPVPVSGAPPGSAAETETLSRLYLEVLGLMPFALPPVPPRPEVRHRLMALAVASSSSGPAAADLEAQPSFAAPAPAHLQGPARLSRRSRTRWPLALAAALILALTAVCGWLAVGLREQQAVVARLAGQRNAALRRAGEMEARLGRLRSRVAGMRDSMEVVTSPAVEVCNLRATAPEAGGAHGVLFVAADHQHWTLSLRGLRPPAGGKVYQLWFVADQGMVSGGTFDSRPGAPMELASAHMPAGTKGVKITLEDSPGAPAPSGPDVMRNADTLHAI
jgi:Anti-sigma-K factor rskA